MCCSHQNVSHAWFTFRRRTSRQSPGCWNMNMSWNPVWNGGRGISLSETFGYVVFFSENCGKFYDYTRKGYWDTTKYRDMRYVIPRPICDGLEVRFGRVWGQKNIICTYHWWIPSIWRVLPFRSLEHAHLNSHDDIVRMQMLRLNANC